MLRSFIRSARAFLNDERGEFSVKGLAVTVGVIVVVGAVVVWLAAGGGMQGMIEELWTALGGWLDGTIGLGW